MAGGNEVGTTVSSQESRFSFSTIYHYEKYQISLLEKIVEMIRKCRITFKFTGFPELLYILVGNIMITIIPKRKCG